MEGGRDLVTGGNRDHSEHSRVWASVRPAEIEGAVFVLCCSWEFDGSLGQLLNPLTRCWKLLTGDMLWERSGNGSP